MSRFTVKSLKVVLMFVLLAIPFTFTYKCLSPIKDSVEHLIPVGILAVEIIVFLMMIKVVKVSPTEALIIQGFRDVTDVRGPGWTFYWHLWETPFFVTTEVISVNVDSQEATTWITPENSDEPAPITVRAKEISVDLKFVRTGNRLQDIQNAKDYLASRRALVTTVLETVDGREQVKEYRANELISDAVQGSFRRYCANPGVPFNMLLYDTGSARRFILTELRSFQRECIVEREETREGIRVELIETLKQKALQDRKSAASQAEKDRIRENFKRMVSHDAIMIQVDRVLAPPGSEMAQYWGVQIQKVTVEEIEPADASVKAAMEAAARVLQEERAEIARVQKEIRVTALEIKRDVNKAEAKGQHFQKLATLIAGAFGFKPGDGQAVQFILNQLSLETAERVAENLGKGGNAIVTGLDLASQIRRAMSGS